MKVARQFSEIEYNKKSIVTVGSFDGVHVAHREVLNEVVHRSVATGGRSTVVTFEPSPREVLGRSGALPKVLTTLDERLELIGQAGVDLLVVIRFDVAFSKQSSREFIEEYLVRRTGLSEVVEGYDHHFGRNREGGLDELRRIGAELGFSVFVVPEVRIEGLAVHSGTIRALVQNGDVESAGKLLGRRYDLTGVVVQGDGRGKRLGYPTANLELTSERKLIPLDGIYLVRAEVEGAQRFGLASIGVRPTFHANGARLVEMHVLEFDGNLYGQRLRMEFMKRLREERMFSSPEELVKQMDADKDIALKLIERYTMNQVIHRSSQR